jgi:hypothetical protein
MPRAKVWRKVCTVLTTSQRSQIFAMLRMLSVSPLLPFREKETQIGAPGGKLPIWVPYSRRR